MEKDTFGKIEVDFINGRITYDEYIKRLCIFKVGIDRFDFYDLAEHDLYIYCTDDTVEVVRDFY